MRGIIDARSETSLAEVKFGREFGRRAIDIFLRCVVAEIFTGNSKLPAPYNETCNTNEGKGVRGNGRGKRKLVNPEGSA
jgi:hypothetical protein